MLASAAPCCDGAVDRPLAYVRCGGNFTRAHVICHNSNEPFLLWCYVAAISLRHGGEERKARPLGTIGTGKKEKWGRCRTLPNLAELSSKTKSVYRFQNSCNCSLVLPANSGLPAGAEHSQLMFHCPPLVLGKLSSGVHGIARCLSSQWL
jgi:hypothetical protein